MNWIIVIICIICIWLIYLVQQYVNLNTNVQGYDKQTAINYIKKANKTPLSQCHVGILQHYNLKNPHLANETFKKTLLTIKNNPTPHNHFIAEKIAETTDNNEIQLLTQYIFFDTPIISDSNSSQKISQKSHHTNPIAKKIEESQIWHSDNHNVHDSAINKFVEEQNYKIKEYNMNNPKYSLAHLRRELQNQNSETLIQVLDDIEKSPSAEILQNVWCRINAPENEEKRSDLFESLKSALLDIKTNEGFVCNAGKSARIIQSLAFNDQDPTLGQLKNKEIIRNEILSKASVIVESYLGDQSQNIESKLYNLSDEEQKKLSDEDYEKLMEYKANILQDITEMAYEYQNKLPRDSIQKIVDEASCVIL
jgi:hypothetical protein